MWRIPAHRSAAQWSALQLEMAAIARAGRRPVGTASLRGLRRRPVGTLVDTTTSASASRSADADLPTVDDGRVVLGPSHGLSGNPGRFRSGALELRRDDRWTTGDADQRTGPSSPR